MPQCQRKRDKEKVSLSRVILALAIATVAAPVVGHTAVASPLRVPQSARRVASLDTIAVRPKPVSLDSVRVIAVWNASAMPSGLTAAGGGAVSGQDPVRAQLDESIILVVRDLRSLDARARCMDLEERPISDCAKQHLAIFLDGLELKGLAPQSPPPRPGERFGLVRFRLERSTASDSTWSELLGNPPLERHRFWYRATELSVGVSGGFPVPTDVIGARFELTRIHPEWFIFTVVVFVGVLILFVRYARISDVLRWSGVDPSEPGRRKPYSLGRCQMAWWTFLVVGAFIFIFLITRSYDTVNSTSLALLGISAGTFLGAAAIDAGGPDTRKQTPPSEGFFDDVLSDATGQSFHRFQMVIWTLVLSVIFAVSVWRRLSMPDFSPTLLGLLGISAGTYLGFKFPEQKS